jgi:type II secretory ATPase GspE/PulE/Tfp pilus assembly ATPase PilB-like protein
VRYEDLAERLGLSESERAAESTQWGDSGTRPLRRLAMLVGIDVVRSAFCEALGVPSIDIGAITVATSVAGRLPRALAEQGLAIPIDLDPNGTLVVAIANPFDYALGLHLSACLEGQQARYVHLSADKIRMLETAGSSASEGAFAQLVSTEVEARVAAEQHDAEPEFDRAPQIGERLVGQIFERAVAARATDVHLDPFRDFETGVEGLRVRFRIDGTARRQPDLCMPGPSGLRTADIVARTLRIAGGATALSSATQDFRIYRDVGGRQVCGRVHTRPAFLGGTGRLSTAQKTSIRILDGRLRCLEDLGLPAELVQTWRAASRVSGRLCLVSGPTGSGKTTLLAATIPAIVDEEEIAYSIEDPVEYHHSLLSQLEIQATTREQRRAHMIALLYDLMREDPDFVMVGEIRDHDSMELAFELALRGAQVVTTMHAGSAVHAVQRLLEWGLDPFIVATNLGAVLNVRLLRRLCPTCRERVNRTDGRGFWTEEIYGRPLPESGFAKSEDGCTNCRYTGTVGQFTVAEFLNLEGTTVDELKDSSRLASLMAGRRTLQDEAARALAAGDTDLVSVLRAHIGTGTAIAAASPTSGESRR